MEGPGGWKFVTMGDGEWRWRAHSDGTEAVSPSVFASIEDCMADAARHGYTNWRPTEAAYA